MLNQLKSHKTSKVDNEPANVPKQEWTEHCQPWPANNFKDFGCNEHDLQKDNEQTRFFHFITAFLKQKNPHR